MIAIGAANQIKAAMDDELATYRIATTDGGTRNDGNGSIVINLFCTANQIRDFALLITARNNGREDLVVKLGNPFDKVDVKPAAFADWQLFKRFANTFTPASFNHADGQLEIIQFENETEERHLLVDKRERAFFEGMQARSGYCIPLVDSKGDRALALVTFDAVPPADKLGSLYFKLLKIFETVDFRHAAETGKAASKLTCREIECLKWVADGKTSLEIAAITNLSVHTINHYMKICCSKLNTVNRIQAAVVAARLRLI